VKYAKVIKGDEKVAKTRATGIRVSFKNSLATSSAIRGMPLRRAQAYLKNVIAHKEVIAFTKYNYGVGRNAACKQVKAHSGRYPEKAAKLFLGLLTNAESNADSQSMDVEDLVISHTQVNQAPHYRRRTYRAHGRINKYESSPSHIELYLTAKPQAVARGQQEGKGKKVGKKLTSGATVSAL